MNPFSNKKWKVTYKRGGGEAYVYGDNEYEAKLNAAILYRKNCTMLDNSSVDEIVDTIVFID